MLDEEEHVCFDDQDMSVGLDAAATIIIGKSK